MYLHPTYALTPQREPLGLLDAWMWARNFKNDEGERVQVGDSARWIEGYERVAERAVQLPNTHLVYVADRESDIIALMLRAQDLGTPADWLVATPARRPGLSIHLAALCFHQRRSLGIVDIPSDTSILDTRDGLVDHEQRNEKPFLGLHGVNGIQQFVLYFGKEQVGFLFTHPVIGTQGEQLTHLLIKALFRGANLADARQKFVEVVLDGFTPRRWSSCLFPVITRNVVPSRHRIAEGGPSSPQGVCTPLGQAGRGKGLDACSAVNRATKLANGPISP
jgi:hypothetical protein